MASGRLGADRQPEQGPPSPPPKAPNMAQVLASIDNFGPNRRLGGESRERAESQLSPPADANADASDSSSVDTSTMGLVPTPRTLGDAVAGRSRAEAAPPGQALEPKGSPQLLEGWLTMKELQSFHKVWHRRWFRLALDAPAGKMPQARLEWFEKAAPRARQQRDKPAGSMHLWTDAVVRRVADRRAHEHCFDLACDGEYLLVSHESDEGRDTWIRAISDIVRQSAQQAPEADRRTARRAGDSAPHRALSLMQRAEDRVRAVASFRGGRR